jgi:Uma2 family endonuclease
VLDPTPQDVRPLRRAEYESLAREGLLEDEQVELLDGAIVRMPPPIGPAHDATIQRLNHLLVRALYPRAAIRIQSSFAASDHSQPQPDVAVVPPGDYFDAHPDKAWLVVEVADSSRTRDRGIKARLYAANGVVEYWVVDLSAGLIEICTEIVAGEYARVTPVRRGERATLVAFPDVTLEASDVLR